MKKPFTYLLATLLSAFGLLTLFLSTSVLFDLFGIREREGQYVLFVVWANFITSLLYLSAVFGLLKGKAWSSTLLGISTLLLVAAFIGLKIHAGLGGAYETKTIGALLFRISVSLGFTISTYFLLTKNKT